MIKKYKNTIILSSVVCVLPTVIGMILWNKLPQQIAIHFNFQGEPDGYSSKAFAVFALPALMLAFHWICIIATSLDKKQETSKKAMVLVLWICPLLSLFLNSYIYAISIGKDLQMGLSVNLIMGISFIIIGNYLPKCKQSRFVGIRIPWTLKDESNWYRTHRIAGKLWVAGGVIICAASAINNMYVLLVITLALAIIPVIYSYVISKK